MFFCIKLVISRKSCLPVQKRQELKNFLPHVVRHTTATVILSITSDSHLNGNNNTMSNVAISLYLKSVSYTHLTLPTNREV